MNKICVAHFLKGKAHLSVWVTERVIPKNQALLTQLRLQDMFNFQVNMRKAIQFRVDR